MKTNKEYITGYKVTDSNMKCRDYKFTVGEDHSAKGEIILCENGFHFCEQLVDCFSYCKFNPSNRVFRVRGSGDFKRGDDKIAVRTIGLVEELSWEDVLREVNTGKGNTGFRNSGDLNPGHQNSGDHNSGNHNSGDHNSGDHNSGDLNSGDLNSGDHNSGDHNSGDLNSGHQNSGDLNSGDHNSGDHNSGDHNSGDHNSGDLNSGHQNSGDLNSGDHNSGDHNSGDHNSGDLNSGHQNSGDHNSGNHNSGDHNSGDHNSGDHNSGFFNPNEPTVRMFGRDTGLYRSQIDIPYVHLPINTWVYTSNMTTKEKDSNPSHTTTDGYLKSLSYKEAWKLAWEDLNEENKDKFKNLPNFDPKIFEEITGITI